MDLPDRGRGHRLGLELGEKLLDRPAQFGLNQLADDLGRVGETFSWSC